MSPQSSKSLSGEIVEVAGCLDWILRKSGLMFVMVGFLFFVVGAGMGVINIWSVMGTTSTEGVITRTALGHIHFQYTVQGATHSGQSQIQREPSPYAVGDRVPVLYKTANPGQARLDTFMELWFFPLVFPLIGVALIGGSFLAGNILPIGMQPGSSSPPHEVRHG